MKITLLGDSTRMNYCTRVTELLGKYFEVFQPGDNGRFSKFTMRMIFDYRDMMAGTKIVHWNNGLQDISLIAANVTKYVRSDDHIHLTEEGNEIADVIRKVAATLN